MGESVPFISKAKQRFEPHPPLVKMLEDMLADAKEGKLQAVICGCVYSNDLEPGGATGVGISTSPYTRYAMAYAVSELNVLWQRDVFENL